MCLNDRHHGGQPLLLVMATPGTTYHRALALFKRRAVYANVHKDTAVRFCTGSIRRHNIYNGIPREQLYVRQSRRHYG